MDKCSLIQNFRHPKLSQVFNCALDLWAHDPLISTALLKFMTELTQNRSQRLLFDVMSPNGVLLFRQVSKTIVIYGKRFSISLCKCIVLAEHVMPQC